MRGDLMTATATDGDSARFALSAAERVRCSELPTPTGRRDFRAGRLAAKRAATALLGALPSRCLEIRSGGDTPPTLTVLEDAGRHRAVPVGLSISHRDDRAVAAAAPARLRVGVDLERSGSIPRSHARYFLAPSEMRFASDTDVTVLSSLKEATWKALRLGRGVPFKPWPGYHLATVWMRGGTA